MAYIENLNYLVWLILAVLLTGLELIIPGVYIIWFGFAAGSLGILLWIWPLPWMVQILLFALLSLAFTLLGIYLNRKESASIDSGELNRARGSEYIGQTFTLDQAVENGVGRLTIGDSSWSITGPDSPKGARVQITELTLNTLHFVPLPPFSNG